MSAPVRRYKLTIAGGKGLYSLGNDSVLTLPEAADIVADLTGFTVSYVRGAIRADGVVEFTARGAATPRLIVTPGYAKAGTS